MNYRVEYTEAGWSDLQNLDIKVSQRIVKKLRYFVSQDDPLKFAKALKGDLRGLYRFRVGDYRVDV